MPAPPAPALTGAFAPRIIADDKRAWLSDEPTTAWLTAALPGTIAELAPADARLPDAVSAWRAAWERVSPDLLLPSGEARRFDWQPGQTRDFRRLFACLEGTDVARLFVRDPYCLNGERNRDACAQFLAEVIKIIGKWPGRIDIAFAPGDQLRDGGDRLSPGEQAQDLRRRLVALTLALPMPATTDLRVVPRRRPTVRNLPHDFHDREVLADVRGPDLTHCFLLTGGIDRLMRQDKECSVVHSIGPGRR